MSNEKKEKWLEERKTCITGTDVAKILGISKWGSALNVWLDKKGRSEPTEESEPMMWGSKLEKPILSHYAEIHHLENFEYCDGFNLVRNDDFPLFGCSLDGWDHEEDCSVDAKNIRVAGEEWGESGTDQFPKYYKAQLAVQMMVTNTFTAKLAVLFSGQEYREYVMVRDPEFEKEIIEKCTEFWKYVEEDVMPPFVGGDDKSTEAVKKVFAEGDAKKEKKADQSIIDLVKKLKEIKKELKELEEKESEIENTIKVWMGDATVCPDVCTWKNSKGKTTTDWQSVAKAFAEDERYEEIVKQFTKTGFGARTFRITLK